LTKNIIVDNYEIPSSKIAVVHNGVELTDETLSEKMFELKKDNKIVLFVGRLTLQKGPDYFLKAAQKVLEHEPHVRFVIVGSGDMKEKLIRDAISLGISDKVIFTGFLRDSSLKALYAAADLFVMPSVSEPFGITGLESAINGTPVLVSRQSGVSEVLHHALQVDFWDIEEMTNKILAVISYAALKRTLKKNVAEEAQQQTWDKSAEKIRDVYRSLLEKR
ncbi:MAG TPA: glycosyltransferase family 4 protein, partial [Candidatus Saccharimonadales bacterium]|nr:glycosyltransferase family 4 protein [Candidatus Saccharimonadales bacterium]